MGNESSKPTGFIPTHGGYMNLLSYQKAEIIYDGTVYFTRRFFSKYDRTVDQMVQAARSGKQNIAEASMAAAMSKETEIKLTSVARASLEELKLDYEDFLRSKGLPIWGKEHRLVTRFRELNRSAESCYQTFRKAIEHPDPEISANVMRCLITVTTWLLKKQMDTLEKRFLEEGGVKEKMLAARLAHRNI